MLLDVSGHAQSCCKDDAAREKYRETGTLPCCVQRRIERERHRVLDPTEGLPRAFVGIRGLMALENLP